MNVYDFDGTIYAGDSSVDFFLFCLRRYPSVLRHLPSQALAAARFYVLKKGDKTEMKEKFFAFLATVNPSDELLEEFWDAHEHKLCVWYLRHKQEDDVLISASPEFLLKPIVRRLGGITLMASPVDRDTGHFVAQNCHGSEKVYRFRKRFPEDSVDCFYSDRLSDSPMAELAKNAFLVKNKDASHYSLERWPHIDKE